MSTLTAPAKANVSASRRHIRRVAVLGAGIMGSRIAMHFANIGVEALLMDLPSKELTGKEQQQGLTLQDKSVRDRFAREQFEDAMKSSPSPIYDKAYAERVRIGNFEDDMAQLAGCDWIIEVVVERLDIKQKIFSQVEEHRSPGTLITTNTSGIPIASMLEGRSEDFRKHFCGTHFFNPPRYLELLEVIPSPETDQQVIDFLMQYGDLHLGKQTVLCKDTPAFIANRVGIFAIMNLLHLVEKHGLTVEEVDTITGKLIGHPKSATFRTADLVGLDTAAKVAKGIYDNCPDDERREVYQFPAFMQYMVDNELWGDKSGKGFYKKVKDGGKKKILTLDLASKEYREHIKPDAKSIEKAKSKDTPADAIRTLLEADDHIGAFFREFTYGLLAYASHRIPEISDDIYSLDDGMRAGFGWGTGPFEKWDIVGVAEGKQKAEELGFEVAGWVQDMLDSGANSFYRVEKGIRQYFDLETKSYKRVPGTENFIILDDLRESSVIWSNEGTSLFDLGDGILNIEFQTKMNAIGQEVVEGIHHALDVAEADYRGLIIGNQGENFSVGANIMMIMMYASQGDWEQLEYAVKTFQDTSMRLRYSDIPVVVAPQSMTLGGGCEFTMHADAVQAAAESYIGLVEVGVGLLPGGAGTKEMAVRMSDRYREGDPEMNVFQDALMTLAQAKVATSAVEAYGLGYLQPHKDRISVNKKRLLTDAKRRCLLLAEEGYTRPLEKRVRVMGSTALGAVETGVYQMRYAGWASEHDELIANKIGYVLAGGNLSGAMEVSERYLLELEREAFLSLAGEQKTQERIQHMVQTNKPLRN